MKKLCYNKDNHYKKYLGRMTIMMNLLTILVVIGQIAEFLVLGLILVELCIIISVARARIRLVSSKGAEETLHRVDKKLKLRLLVKAIIDTLLAVSCMFITIECAIQGEMLKSIINSIAMVGWFYLAVNSISLRNNSLLNTEKEG